MLTYDRADELKTMPDVWTEIQPHLDQAASDAISLVTFFAHDLDDYLGPSLRLALELKFRNGEDEHGRDWLDMTRDQLDEELQNEIIDLIVYRAMILARWQQRDADDALVIA